MWIRRSACLYLQVFLKGKAKRHSDMLDGQDYHHRKTKPVADFLMEGNDSVTYGKIVHWVG